MTPEQLTHTRQQLEAFAAEIFTPLTRCDQRAKGLTYLRGLLLDGRRKSMQPMAERLGVDHQSLQQFLTSSTWDFRPVRHRLAHRATQAITPLAWVIDDTGFPKDGTASPGVTRQYSGTLGKVGNCQIGVSVHAVTDVASCPLTWRLFLPACWDAAQAADPEAARHITARRARCAIPAGEGHRPKWQLALEMLDELTGQGLTPAVVVADAAYGDNAALRAALSDRHLRYVVQVKGSVTAHAIDAVPAKLAYSGLGPHPKARYRTRPVSLREHVLAAGPAAARSLAWRNGSKGCLRSEFVIVPARIAGHRPRLAADGSLPVSHVIAEWPREASEPTAYWLSNLPAETPPADLITLAKIRWRIEHDYRELKTGLGLDHFEGRSWSGWHRHVTLVTAAHLFCTELRLSSPKAAGAA
ncbi:IS701 family transposase [Streptosporangium saharense]|uniref:SRSO17 transposase n=1 Tax=Streptosporangium saharense TaxID=1706840 RepID=A0A7W7QN94_9ACTN|nr:IS701 family transposase [Streptosporangium saharense]MBB4916637.1 SRSO17 transposase [Streptosporangium saharense]